MCGSCKHLENAWFDVMIVWRELQSTKGGKREYAWHVCVWPSMKTSNHTKKKKLQINILSAMLLPLNVNTANHVALNRNKALNSQQPKEEEEEKE